MTSLQQTSELKKCKICNNYPTATTEGLEIVIFCEKCNIFASAFLDWETACYYWNLKN